MSWFSLAIGQNASRQLATSSENLVASPQFLVALATSESQCRALCRLALLCYTHKIKSPCITLYNTMVLTVARFFGIVVVRVVNPTETS